MLVCHISGTKFPRLYSIAEGMKCEYNSLQTALIPNYEIFTLKDSYPQ